MRTIVLSGPGKNALSTEVMGQTLAALRAAPAEPIFLTGEGDAFSAGLNLKEIVTLDGPGMARFLDVLETLVRELYEHPAPVVAWVNGHAIAGGCVLALCADVRVMSARPGARIGLNETALGLRFPPLTFAMIRASLAAPTLARVVLEAGLYEASEARALGLVDAIGEEDVARAKLATMAAYPGDVYADMKLLARGRLAVTEEERHRFLEHTLPQWSSEGLRVKLRSLLEKRR
jgi:enoyl-CoA hydratase/carnithine racemase